MLTDEQIKSLTTDSFLQVDDTEENRRAGFAGRVYRFRRMTSFHGIPMVDTVDQNKAFLAFLPKNLSICDADRERLERFLAQFPDDATNWSDATEEPADLLVWMQRELNPKFPDETPNDPIETVGRQNCNTPAKWNTQYKAAVRRGFEKLSPAQRAHFFTSFAEWLK